MSDDHFKIRNVPGYQGSAQENNSPPMYSTQPYKQVQETAFYIRYTRILWIFASTSLVVLNILSGFMTIRDMYNTTYSPYNHYFMTSAFALTIGVLAIVHTNILKKDN